MVLVTGATGLVGSHLTLHLIENGETVLAIYRNLDSLDKTKSLFRLYDKEFLFDKIEWIQADITDVPTLEIAFHSPNIEIENVYHCAALITFDASEEEKLRKINIEGTANIVNFCIDKHVKKLCFVSSIAALGDLKDFETIVTEETEWNPEKHHNDYAISKFGAEMEIRRGQQEGLQIAIINPGVILGPGFWDQGSGEIFSKTKNGLPFYTKGITGFVAVTDIASILYKIMKSEINGERFVIIAENLKLQEVLNGIADGFKVKQPRFYAPYWLTEVAWRLDWLFSFLTRKRRTFFKDTSKAAHNTILYSNEKAISVLDYKFKNIKEYINEVIALEMKKN